MNDNLESPLITRDNPLFTAVTLAPSYDKNRMHVGYKIIVEFVSRDGEIRVNNNDSRVATEGNFNGMKNALIEHHRRLDTALFRNSPPERFVE